MEKFRQERGRKVSIRRAAGVFMERVKMSILKIREV